MDARLSFDTDGYIAKAKGSENGVRVQKLTEIPAPLRSVYAKEFCIEFFGAYYYVMTRGNRRETIFHNDDDRRFFLATLFEACAMTGWRVHAWVLMGNHYHVFIETPEANLVAGMSWLQNTVTRRYNVRHQAWGRLFGDRYKAVLVGGADTYHYRTLADYIHLNPVRARLVLE